MSINLNRPPLQDGPLTDAEFADYLRERNRRAWSQDLEDVPAASQETRAWALMRAAQAAGEQCGSIDGAALAPDGPLFLGDDYDDTETGSLPKWRRALLIIAVCSSLCSLCLGAALVWLVRSALSTY